VFVAYTRHRVEDYDRWKKAFDENSPMLAESGVAWEIVRVNGDPTDVVVLCRCPSEKEWNAFLAADKASMERTDSDPREKGGLVGVPEWWTGETAGE
jgi:hypothetical protein